jgi:hypothetical protein
METTTVATTTAADRRRRADAMLWAAGVAWVGALAAIPAALLLDAAFEVVLAFGSIFVPAAAEADPTEWMLTVAVAAMVSCLATALGAAWVLATTPGSKAPPWLVGTLSGVLGWAVGIGVGWLALSA